MPAELLDEGWLIDRLDAGATVRDVAAETGTDPRRVQRALRSFGLKWIPAPQKLLDIEWLTEQHATRTGAEIAEELGVTRVTIYKYLRRAGLSASASRDRGRSTRLAYDRSRGETKGS